MTTQTKTATEETIGKVFCPHDDLKYYVLVDESVTTETPVCFQCVQQVVDAFMDLQNQAPHERPHHLELITTAHMVRSMRGREPIPCQLQPYGEDALEGDESVSYTHLTLPTICSV